MKYFKPNEFNCPCGECELGYTHMQDEALEKLDDARRRAGVPFILTSAMRCEKHNRETGGSFGSAHLDGWGFDIRTSNAHSRMKIFFGLVNAGFNRIGVYEHHIHADCDPTKIPEVCWLRD